MFSINVFSQVLLMQVMQSVKALDLMLTLCQRIGGESESKGSRSTVNQK